MVACRCRHECHYVSDVLRAFSVLALFLIIRLQRLSEMETNNFTLKSNSLRGQGVKKMMFNGMNCSGDNLSPQLEWEDVPDGTKSFAVTIYDPKAPTLSGWYHWVVFNIPADVRQLDEGAGDPGKDIMPRGAVQSKTDFGTNAYGGPCPPVGDPAHPYHVTVYALDTEDLGLASDASPAMVSFMVEQHTIQRASMIFYARHQ